MVRRTKQKNGYEPEALLNFVALMGWSRQAAVSGSDQAMPTIRAANFGASSAKSNAAVPVSKSTIAGQRMKRRLDPEEDVIDSDVMTLQELIDNVSPSHFVSYRRAHRLTVSSSTVFSRRDQQAPFDSFHSETRLSQSRPSAQETHASSATASLA